MSIAGDHGNIVGNHENKYESSNPIARYLVSEFLREVTELYASTCARSVLEVGCGEGRLATHLVEHGHRPDRFVACDLEIHTDPRADPLIEFMPASIYALPFENRSFELVLCCEVLEHLQDPARGLKELARVAERAVILSTPWEPVWRAFNVARGRYWGSLGNTPGHIQHFSRRSLVELASPELKVVTTRHPIPWTVLLGHPR